MAATLSFTRECGISTVGSNARPAFRMRVNISAIGSIIKKSPTGLHHARNQTIERGFAERQAGSAELAQVTATAAGHRATIDEPRWTGVARELRQTGVIAFGLQFRPDRGVLLDRVCLALVALNPCCLGHIIICLRRTACPSTSEIPAPRHPCARWSQS